MDDYTDNPFLRKNALGLATLGDANYTTTPMPTTAGQPLWDFQRTGLQPSADRQVTAGDSAYAGGGMTFADQGFAGVGGAPAPVPSAAPAAPAGGYAPMGLAGIGMRVLNAPSSGPVVPGAPAASSTYDGGIYDASTGRAAADAAYGQATQYFEPDFARDRSALETQLINQGFARGTEAFDAEMGKLTRNQNQARTGAALGAVGTGNAQALGVGNLNLGARGQDLQTEIALRNLGLSENSQGMQQLLALVAAARSGVPQLNFGSPSPLDVSGAYGINQSAANMNATTRAANNAGLYNLGATLLGSYFGR